jgi:hypothetical protein
MKQIAKVAKEHKRANRDDDMDFFVVYYKEKFLGVKFKDFKQKDHPNRIKALLLDKIKAHKVCQFIKD